MIFEVGDIVKHNAAAFEYIVIDVTEDNFTVGSWPKRRFREAGMVIDRASWPNWTVLEGRDIVPRPRKTRRNLDL